MKAHWSGVIVTTMVLLSALSVSAREPGTAEIEIVPAHPAPSDVVSARLSGVWPDSCTPRAPRVSRFGQEIFIDTSDPLPTVCLPVLTRWALEAAIGTLPEGTYWVTARHQSREIGRTAFTVEDGGSVGGAVTGLGPALVVCRNMTTRKTVVIADGARSWDCEEAGLSVRPGDRIQITITGRAD